jgi:hypothetical protein
MTIQKYQDFSGSNPPPTAPSAYTYTKNEEPEIVFATVLYDTDTAIAADVAAESKILAPITQKTSKPPKNCPDGGTWGILLYNGEKTKSIACLACLCLGLLGLCVLACPQDEKVSILIFLVCAKLHHLDDLLSHHLCSAAVPLRTHIALMEGFLMLLGTSSTLKVMSNLLPANRRTNHDLQKIINVFLTTRMRVRTTTSTCKMGTHCMLNIYI